MVLRIYIKKMRFYASARRLAMLGSKPPVYGFQPLETGTVTFSKPWKKSHCALPRLGNKSCRHNAGHAHLLNTFCLHVPGVAAAKSAVQNEDEDDDENEDDGDRRNRRAWATLAGHARSCGGEFSTP